MFFFSFPAFRMYLPCTGSVTGTPFFSANMTYTIHQYSQAVTSTTVRWVDACVAFSSSTDVLSVPSQRHPKKSVYLLMRKMCTGRECQFTVMLSLELGWAAKRHPRITREHFSVLLGPSLKKKELLRDLICQIF